jgi:ATP-dependent DNA helicase RecG
MWTIEELKYKRESEDKIEFKKGEQGNISYDGASKMKPSDRRKCILGYVIALCNEGGGSLVIGMEDAYPHKVVGTKQNEGSIGQLESDIYRDTEIRPHVYELYENPELKQGRILVIDVPSRPIGVVFKYEDVPLMRVGEELKPMSDEVYLKIIQEKEPDFSQQICKEATIDDLDEQAIDILRHKYATKQNNPSFLTLPKEQILSDLDLIVGEKVTNAAIILVGKKEAIKRFLPQAAIMLEYRNTENQIPFDNRSKYDQPFYIMIDQLWHDIDLRNGKFPVKEGPYIFDIPYFNEEVIREAVNNAIAHRDYRKESEIVIKQYPQKFVISNAGGFPLGVTLDNLLTVSSTPRNRLLADVLSKTGIVERSGQGIDKIFKNTISEGKQKPDYSQSDRFHVELALSAVIKDRAFALFIESEQAQLPEEQKLSVFEIMALANILEDKTNEVNKATIESLLRRGLIEKHGKTKGTYYILSKNYYDFAGDIAIYAQKTEWNTAQASMIIIPYLLKFQQAKMKDFSDLMSGHLTRRQVRSLINQMVDEGILNKFGVGSGTTYVISDNYAKNTELVVKALGLGLEELKKRGEI